MPETPDNKENPENSAEANGEASNVQNGGGPDFDGAVSEIERQISELETLSEKHGVDFAENIATLREQKEEILRTLVENLSPWERVCMARHRDRPTAKDYIANVCDSFIELHGDRAFADDKAIITGFGVSGNLEPAFHLSTAPTVTPNASAIAANVRPFACSAAILCCTSFMWTSCQTM